MLFAWTSGSGFEVSSSSSNSLTSNKLSEYCDKSIPFFSITSSTMMNFDSLSVRTCSILSEGYSESTGMNAAPDFRIPNADAITLLFLFNMNIILSSGPTPLLIRLWAILLAFSFNAS